jgi:hypothetical protein
MAGHAKDVHRSAQREGGPAAVTTLQPSIWLRSCNPDATESFHLRKSIETFGVSAVFAASRAGSHLQVESAGVTCLAARPHMGLPETLFAL